MSSILLRTENFISVRTETYVRARHMSSRLEIRLDPELKFEFERLVKERGLSMSDTVRDLIRMWTEMARKGFDIVRLVEEAVKSGHEESKYILTLELSGRYAGCGWRYLWGTEIIRLLGDVEIVELAYHDSEGECLRTARVAIIPRTVPTIIAVCRIDEDPEAGSDMTVYVFDGEGWRSMTLNLGSMKTSFDPKMVIYSV